MDDNVAFLRIVPSMLNVEANAQDDTDSDFFRVSRMTMLLENIVDVLKTVYELKREPATEAVVFLCCDHLDRNWDTEKIRSAHTHVCWFPKGTSI